MYGTGRRWPLLGFIGAALLWGASPGAAQNGSSPLQSIPQGTELAEGLQSHVISQPGRPHTVVVTDPVKKVIAVYFIDPANGNLDLKSVRNISWDLDILQHNTGDPKPQDVRAGLPR